MSHNGFERNRFIHAMTEKLCTCCAMRYDWSCSSCSSNFAYRDSQKSARKNGWVCSCTTQAEKEFVKRKRLLQEIEMTQARAQSLASQVFSSENDIGNFVGVRLTDADRWKVLFNCWSPPWDFSFLYITVGAQNRSYQKQWLNEFAWLAYSNIYNVFFLQIVRCVCSSDCQS